MRIYLKMVLYELLQKGGSRKPADQLNRVYGFQAKAQAADLLNKILAKALNLEN